MNQYLQIKKKEELKAKLTFKRGRLYLTPEERQKVKNSLVNVWGMIGADIEEAYRSEHKSGYPPQSTIREVVLDQFPTYGMDYFNHGNTRVDNSASPALQYLFAYPYEEETRGIMSKLAKEINF